MSNKKLQKQCRLSGAVKNVVKSCPDPTHRSAKQVLREPRGSLRQAGMLSTIFRAEAMVEQEQKRAKAKGRDLDRPEGQEALNKVPESARALTQSTQIGKAIIDVF